MTERSHPLRYAGRAVAALLAVGFVALLAYGLLTKSGDTTVDDALSKSRSVATPRAELPVLIAPAPGSAAATRIAPALADGRVNLRELQGSPVVLNFWASWCVPCRDEAPLLERQWRANRDAGVVFVGLDMQDLTDDARAFADRFATDYLTIRDRGNDVARRFGVTGLPETFFISARGRIVAHVIGVVSPAQLADGIAAARAGRPLGVSDGGARRDTR